MVPGLLAGAASAVRFAACRASMRLLGTMTRTDHGYKPERVAVEVERLEARVLGVIAGLWILVWALVLGRPRRQVLIK